MSQPLLLVCIFCLVCSTGCFRHCYRSHPYSLCQTDLGENVQEALETGVVRAGELPSGAWWVFFQDEQLDRLMEVSLACHPDIHIAEARITRAYEEARVARSALFPHLFGLADVQRKKISKLGEGFVPSLPTLFTQTTLKLTSAVYELDVWKKNRSIYYASLDLAQAKRAEYEEARLLLSTALAGVYFDLQMKWARKEVTEKRLAARRELYALHKQQFDLGIISEFRLYETDTDVQLLQDFVYVLEGEIAIDQHTIAALAGNVCCLCGTDGKLEVTPAAQFNHPFPLPSTLPIDLLARRPDVTAQRWRVEAACFGIKVAQANFFPRIDLLGWVGVQSILIGKLFRGETLVALGEGAGALPLFLAGKLQGDLGVAREDLEIAIEIYNQLILNSVQQVSDALSDLQTATKRKLAVEDALKDATGLLDLTQQKYEKGVANKLTFLNALENVFVQQDLKVQIQLARFEAAVELIRAIGGGYYDNSSL